MKFYSVITCLIAVVTVAQAIPMGVSLEAQEVDLSKMGLSPENELVARMDLDEIMRVLPRGEDDISEEFVQLLSDKLLKRDYPALTVIFTQLNQSGQGVAIVKAFATNGLTQGTVVKAIAEYIQQKTLLTILSAAYQSKLAYSLVIAIISDYSILPGVITIGKSLYASGVLKKRELDERDLFGNILGGIGGLFGVGPSTTAAAAVKTTTAAAPTTAGAGVVPSLAIPSLSTPSIPGVSIPSIAGVSYPSLSIPTDIPSVSGLALPYSSAAFPDPTLASSILSVPTTLQSVASAATSQYIAPLASPKAAPAATTSGGGILGGIFSGIGNTIGSLLGGISSTVGNVLGNLGQGNVGGAIGSAVDGVTGTIGNVTISGVSGLQNAVGSILSGTQQTLINTVISLIKNVGDLEQLCESLEKSGLGVSVVRSLLVDTQEQVFTEKLVTYIVQNKIVTLSSLFSDLLLSGALVGITTQILTTPSALSQVFAFVIWIIENLGTLF